MKIRSMIAGALGLIIVMGTLFGQTSPTTRPSPAGSLTPDSAPAPAKWIGVSFSPKLSDDCLSPTEAILQEITNAQKRIRIQAYYFTSRPIAKALIEAKKRGVKTTLILDTVNQTDKDSVASLLKKNDATVLIDDAHAIAHNKIMLIDDDVLITGSFNFTESAETSNAENLLVLKGLTGLYAQYDANFAEHLKHSKPYTGPVTPPPSAKRTGTTGQGNITHQTSTPPAETPPERLNPSGGIPTGETTTTGLPIYQGPRGGRYHISKSGKKVYERKKR